MEVAHARLSSLLRNFLVKYADDITFDFAKYQPVDENKDKHQFFEIIDRNNDRMQHLSLLGRLLLIEQSDGPTDVRDKILGDWIDETQAPDGIGTRDGRRITRMTGTSSCSRTIGSRVPSTSRIATASCARPCSTSSNEKRISWRSELRQIGSGSNVPKWLSKTPFAR